MVVFYTKQIVRLFFDNDFCCFFLTVQGICNHNMPFDIQCFQQFLHRWYFVAFIICTSLCQCQTKFRNLSTYDMQRTFNFFYSVCRAYCFSIKRNCQIFCFFWHKRIYPVCEAFIECFCFYHFQHTQNPIVAWNMIDSEFLL